MAEGTPIYQEETLSGTPLLIIIVYHSSARKYSFCAKDHKQILNIKIKRNKEERHFINVRTRREELKLKQPKQAVFVLQASKWLKWRRKSCANGSICNQDLLITDHREMNAPI